MKRPDSVRACLEGYPGHDNNPTLQDLAKENPPLLPDRPESMCYPVAEPDPRPPKPMAGSVWKGEPVIQGGKVYKGTMVITPGKGITPAGR